MGFTLDLGTHAPAAIPVTLGLLAQLLPRGWHTLKTATAKSQQLAQLPAWEERVVRTMAADCKAHLLLRHPRARIPGRRLRPVRLPGYRHHTAGSRTQAFPAPRGGSHCAAPLDRGKNRGKRGRGPAVSHICVEGSHPACHEGRIPPPALFRHHSVARLLRLLLVLRVLCGFPEGPGSQRELNTDKMSL